MSKVQFFKLEGLAGDSKVDEAHQGWFDLINWHEGPTLPSGTGRSSGQETFSYITVTLPSGRSSGLLYAAVSDNREFSKATIEIVQTQRDAKGQEKSHTWRRDLINYRASDFHSTGEVDVVTFDRPQT